VAGILLESKTDNDGNIYLIGIGINCHQNKDSFPPELQPIATSIDIESHLIADRISLAKRLLTSLDHWLEVAERNRKKVTDQWCKLSIQLNHRVALIFNGTRFAGNCIGIDPQKGLVLQLDTGGVRMFDAAHTSILR
jgi:BirA family biotin operon repressor/biotin-[acetyl-CoA-carboxylase] ligase